MMSKKYVTQTTWEQVIIMRLLKIRSIHPVPQDKPFWISTVQFSSILCINLYHYYSFDLNTQSYSKYTYIYVGCLTKDVENS